MTVFLEFLEENMIAIESIIFLFSLTSTLWWALATFYAPKRKKKWEGKWSLVKDLNKKRAKKGEPALTESEQQVAIKAYREALFTMMIGITLAYAISIIGTIIW